MQPSTSRPLLALLCIPFLLASSMGQDAKPSADSGEGLLLAANDILAGKAKGKTIADARKLLEQAADKNHAPAQLALARLILSAVSQGEKPDPERAEFLIQQAAEAGLASAQAAYGNLLLSKIDPKARDVNYTEAVSWIKKAAEQKDIEAVVSLANMELTGTSMPANPPEGFKKMQQAAMSGYPFALNECGVCLQKGLGAARDEIAAIGYFHAAADLGSTAAMVNLGACYRNGAGVPKDFSKAGMQFAAAAARNFPMGQFLLAEMLEKGEGAPAHAVHAAINYQRAMDGGLEDAKPRLEALIAKFSPAEKKDWESFKATGKIPENKNTPAKPGKK
jgi:uncharacterized protein